MKRLILIFSVIACLLFSSCGFLSGGRNIPLSVPTTSTITLYGEAQTNQFFVDKTIKREDGFYEVICRRLTEETNEVAQIRYLFSTDGTYIGTRTISGSDNSDFIDLFDATFESYTAGIESGIDHIDGNRIYMTDGGYEDLELDGGRIVHVKGYNNNGILVSELKFNEYGQAHYVMFADESGEPYVEIRTNFQTVKP